MQFKCVSLLLCSWTFVHAGVAQERQRAARILTKVVDTAGKPAPGVEVIVRWRVHPELPGLAGHTLGNRGLAELRSKTDGKGRCRIDLPHRGPFLVLAAHGGKSSVRVFPVMAGDRPLLRLEENGWIGGTVTLPGGKAAVDLPVRLVPQQQAWSRLACYRIPERRAKTRTGPNGRFRLAFEHGYLRGLRWGSFMLPWVETKLANPTLPIVRPNQSARELVLQLGPSLTWQGSLVDDASNPLAGVELFDCLVRDRKLRTDAKGRFQAPNPSGPYWAIADGYTPLLVTGQGPKLTVSSGGRLRAKLVDPSGAPLAGARVLAAVSASLEYPPFERVMRTGADGSIEVPFLPYNLDLHAFVEHDGVFHRFYRGRESKVVDLETVKLAPARVTGRIESALGEPLAHVRVVLNPKETDLSPMVRVTYTDRLGRFAFNAVMRDDHVLAVSADGQGMLQRPIGGARFTKPQVLKLKKGDEYPGRILDPDGEPVDGAWVTLWRSPQPYEALAQSGMVSQCVLTGRDGKFVFRGLTGSGWMLQSKYLRDGSFFGGMADVSPGKSIDVRSALDDN